MKRNQTKKKQWKIESGLLKKFEVNALLHEEKLLGKIRIKKLDDAWGFGAWN